MQREKINNKHKERSSVTLARSVACCDMARCIFFIVAVAAT